MITGSRKTKGTDLKFERSGLYFVQCHTVAICIFKYIVTCVLETSCNTTCTHPYLSVQECQKFVLKRMLFKLKGNTKL